MTIWKNVKKYKTEGSSSNLNKDRSGRRKTEHTQESTNILQEKLILKNACKKRMREF